MRAGRVPALLRWALLAAVVAGVIAMHHVPAAQDAGGHGAADTVAITVGDSANPVATASGHGPMLHPCLAVLTSGGLLLLLALVLVAVTAGPPAWRARESASPPGAARPPPPGGRQLLTAVCVLRL